MRVLVIDDEPLVRRSLTRALESFGHEVFEAVDGVDGVEKWSKENPDVVFLDVLMPRLNGPQVLQKMDGERHCKVIMMSAYSGESDFESIKDCDIDRFISKPFDDIFSVAKLAEEV